MFKKFFNWVVLSLTILSSMGSSMLVPIVAKAAACPTLRVGDLFKVSGSSAVYLLNSDLQRLYFPNGDVYKTWYVDYSGVQEIPNTCVDNYPAPSAPPYGVNFRPGSRLVKVQISPSVYVVETGNKIAKIGSEAVASALYGTNWASKVADIADVFWPNYVARTVEITQAIPHSGMLVKAIGDSTVYFVKDGSRYAVVGTPRGDVQIVSSIVLNQISDSGNSIPLISIYEDPTQTVVTDASTPVLDKPTNDPIPSSSNIRITSASGDSVRPSMAWTGTNYGVVWTDTRDGGKSDIYFALLDENGKRIGDEKRLTNTPDLISANPEIVYGKNEFAVVYSEYSDITSSYGVVNLVKLNLNGTFIGSSIEIINGIDVAFPKIASDGSGYAIIWRTPHNTNAKTYFSYLDADGSMLTNQIRVLTADGSDQTELIWDGSMFCIIYKQSEKPLVYGQVRNYTVGTYMYRVDKRANAESGIVFIGPNEALAAVWNGTNYAVLEDSKTFSTFGSNGNKIIANKEVLQNGYTDPDMVYDHTKYGIVGQNSGVVKFVELNNDGSIAQAEMVLNDVVNSTSLNPRIVWSGINYAVVWSDTVDKNNGAEIYFRKVDTAK